MCIYFYTYFKFYCICICRAWIWLVIHFIFTLYRLEMGQSWRGRNSTSRFSHSCLQFSPFLLSSNFYRMIHREQSVQIDVSHEVSIRLSSPPFPYSITVSLSLKVLQIYSKLHSVNSGRHVLIEQTGGFIFVLMATKWKTCFHSFSLTKSVFKSSGFKLSTPTVHAQYPVLRVGYFCLPAVLSRRVVGKSAVHHHCWKLAGATVWV